MAAIDKVYEFYTCLNRFAFLCSCYAPDEVENIPDLKNAFDKIIEYSQSPQVMIEIEDAKEYLEEMNEELEMMKRKDLISSIVKECTR